MTSAADMTYFRFVGDTWRNCGDTAGQTSALASDQQFSSLMKGNYSQEFSENQTLMNNLTTNLSGIINAGPGQQGETPTELAAQDSQAINAAAASNQKIQQEIGVNGAKSGSANPGVESGVEQAERANAATGVDTNLNNAEANITQHSYDVGRQNYWSAVEGQEKAPGAFEDPSKQAANAVTCAKQTTDTQANANAASSTGTELLGLSEGLGSDAATYFGAKKACWIAAEVFDGWDDPRVDAARNFIFNIWAKESFVGNLVTKLYLAIGEQFAKIVKRSRILKSILKPLFEIAVRKNR